MNSKASAGCWLCVVTMWKCMEPRPALSPVLGERTQATWVRSASLRLTQ